jgi:tetratricopeptide (TPR) repeat protein
MGSGMMFTGMARSIVLILGLLALLSGLRPAFADDAMAKPKDAAAQARLSGGNKLYRVREFEKAVDEYKAGALIEDVPVFHYNLGQCYRQLGRYEDAIWHYERFIERGKPIGEMRGAVDAFLSQMRGELDKKAMRQPPVDPAPEPKPPLQTVPPSQPKTTVIRVPGEAWYRDGIGWGLVGVGAVGLGISTYLVINAKGLEDDANDQQFQTDRDELRDRASSRRTIGTVVGIGGVGLLVAGLVKLAVHPPDREEAVTTSLNVGFTGDGVFVMGRF